MSVWSFCQGFASDSSLWTYHSPDANASSHTRIQPTTVSPTYVQSADLSLPHSLMARQTHKEKLCHSEINGYVSAKQSDIVCCAYCSKLLQVVLTFTDPIVNVHIKTTYQYLTITVPSRI